MIAAVWWAGRWAAAAMPLCLRMGVGVDIPRQYITDENDRRVGVQLDMDTFERIEEALENRGLMLLMHAAADYEFVELEEAKALCRADKD